MLYRIRLSKTCGIIGENMVRDNACMLTLEQLLFDKIEFRRVGNPNDKDIIFKLEIEVDRKRAEEFYRVRLTLIGDKENDYRIEIVLSGYFSFKEGRHNLSLDEQKKLISQNAVAILMPYLRSEISLLTAQPGVECVVMPPINVLNLIRDSEERLH